MDISWQDLERTVREIASTHWDCPAVAEEVSGVRCDAVLRPSPEEMIVIEISKERSLSKLRTDLAKFATIKSAHVPLGIVVRSYFVSSHDVSSLKVSGKSQNVNVMSVNEFRDLFVGKGEYDNQRGKSEFGSALDLDTNKNDTNDFVETRYFDRKTGQSHSIDDIVSLLSTSQNIVLLGEFGTGKSRCAREVFSKFSAANNFFPILTINLREHWGHQSFDLIVRSHLSAMGLSGLEDRAVRMVRNGMLPLILDGMDEIGSQSWSGEPERLRELRRRSLQGVRDLLRRSNKRGTLICGRAHYFSNDEEMLSCLGLDESAIILECPAEFTEAQANKYLQNNTKLKVFPAWSPRKPLICQLFSKLEHSQMEQLIAESDGEVDFFEKTLDAICVRETKIHPTIDAEVLKQIMLGIANIGRKKDEKNEEISQPEINEVFHEASGFSPLDEASSILQRLPYLGRVASGNGNRRFIDDYAMSGLRGIFLTNAFITSDKNVAEMNFRSPLGEFGSKFLGANNLIGDHAEKYVRFCNTRGNHQIAADYLCSSVAAGSGEINFARTPISNATIDSLELTDTLVKGLSISGTFIENLVLDNTIFEDSCISETAVLNVIGATNRDHLPDVFLDNCTFENFSSADNPSRISELDLTDAQKTLISMLRKLFLQPGSGREESALLRGKAAYWDRKVANDVIKLMISEGVVVKHKDQRGVLYKPNRRDTHRVNNILSLLNNSEDALWSLARSA